MESGFSMLPLAALRDRRLTYRTLTVLGALCSFRQGSDDISIVAGRDKIAERCRLHQSVISSATTELEKLGWVEKVGRGGRSVKTTYRLTTPKTVADSATVTQPETVTDYVSKTVADSATRLYRTEVYTDICVKKPSADPDYFADFWKQYPKKVAKPLAMKAWRKIKPTGQLLADLMAGLQRMNVSADWLKSGGQFIPHPATWLNDRRWEDSFQTSGTTANDETSIFAGAL